MTFLLFESPWPLFAASGVCIAAGFIAAFAPPRRKRTHGRYIDLTRKRTGA